MRSEVRGLLDELHRELASLYSNRLKGLHLFGSYARGDAELSSDVDVLVVLDEVASYGLEVERTSRLVGDLALRHDLSVSRVFVPESEWQRGATAFLTTVRGEAISV
jgi:uncharacterized protein